MTMPLRHVTTTVIAAILVSLGLPVVAGAVTAGPFAYGFLTGVFVGLTVGVLGMVIPGQWVGRDGHTYKIVRQQKQ